MRETLLEAALAKFRSDAMTARANLEVYLTAPVGVGEHSDLVDEVAKQAAILTEAEENVRTLENLLEDVTVSGRLND